MAEEGSDVYPTIDDNESIDEKQDSPPPPYKAYRGITSSPGYMEKRTLSSTKDDKAVFRGIERPNDETSNSSTSKKHWKVKALYIIITLILGAGLISALLYFILQYVNQKSVITTNNSKAPGMTEGQNSGLPPESPGDGSSGNTGAGNVHASSTVLFDRDDSARAQDLSMKGLYNCQRFRLLSRQGQLLAFVPVRSYAV
ncbi:uncharacterized protein [Argopecten irradians]|uniref:uncharacterized protein n=1 Tax=Argopecten irradians TaxID=31199 RepID=UPI0037139021